jgi:hypothetical protein
MKNAAISILLSILLVSSGAVLITTRRSNQLLSEELKEAREKAESLVTERNEWKARKGTLQSHADSLQAENETLARWQAQSKAHLVTEEQRVRELTRALEQLNRKGDDLLAQQKQGLAQLAEVKSANTLLTARNKELETKTASLTAAQQQWTAAAQAAQQLEKENVIITPINAKDKPDACARRVKKIMASVVLAGEMPSPVFQLYGPDGKPLPESAGTFASQSKATEALAGNPASLLDITYSINTKLKPGLYRLEISNQEAHRGYLYFKLQ